MFRGPCEYEREGLQAGDMKGGGCFINACNGGHKGQQVTVYQPMPSGLCFVRSGPRFAITMLSGIDLPGFIRFGLTTVVATLPLDLCAVDFADVFAKTERV